MEKGRQTSSSSSFSTGSGKLAEVPSVSPFGYDDETRAGSIVETTTSNSTHRSSSVEGSHKKKSKHEKKKLNKKRKLDGPSTKAATSRTNSNIVPSYRVMQTVPWEGRKISSGKKTKKKKDGKNKDHNEGNPSKPRRLPTNSSRDHRSESITSTTDSIQQSQSPNPSSTSGRVKKSKKKAAAAAAAAAMHQNQDSSNMGTSHTLGLSNAQAAVDDMMRRALEEDQYSALGSVVDTDSSDDDESDCNAYVTYGNSHRHLNNSGSHEPTGNMVRLDRNLILNSMRKKVMLEGMRGSSNVIDGKKRSIGSMLAEDHNFGETAGGISGIDDEKATGNRGSNRKSKKRKKGKRNGVRSNSTHDASNESSEISGSIVEKIDETQRKVDIETMKMDGEKVERSNEGKIEDDSDKDYDGEESSIFGQTAGSSNATWVECDKCKKWRRLRGIVDAKKLPSKWYCNMNKGDLERSKCSAPEEEYETPSTPESASDMRTRKHMRLWVRRLKSNENYEARLPTMTRGKRRSATTHAKEPYEWVRCCNPSCGKWRSLLRFMDASTVMESVKNGEWYCVLNTWDEKTASCSAPQENLPVIGCPPWVTQD